MLSTSEVIIELIEFAAKNWEKESEYDGRMETWCFFCGRYQEDHQPEMHNEDCLHVTAKALLTEKQA